MNKLAQKITDLLSSTLLICVFTFWLFANNALSFVYLDFISELAILIGLLILRAEKAQSERLERLTKQAATDSKKDLKETREVKAMIAGGE